MDTLTWNHSLSMRWTLDYHSGGVLTACGARPSALSEVTVDTRALDKNFPNLPGMCGTPAP